MNSFAASGVQFNTYTTAPLNVSGIITIAGMTPEAFLAETEVNNSLQRITTSQGSYLFPGTSLKQALERDIPVVAAYEDAPAIQASLHGPIISIDGAPTHNITELSRIIQSHSPGDTVTILTGEGHVKEIVNVTLADRNGKAYLGIGVIKPSHGPLTGWIYKIVENVKDPFIYYEPVWGNDFTWFVYYLLWWIVLINISVALMNMLPVGIFDGGRFFYLTVLHITGSEKVSRKAFSIATWICIAMAVWLMVRWALAFI
jgi:membrane-associated protease RseP (regulator of RpoE activity)